MCTLGELEDMTSAKVEKRVLTDKKKSQNAREEYLLQSHRRNRELQREKVIFYRQLQYQRHLLEALEEVYQAIKFSSNQMSLKKMKMN